MNFLELQLAYAELWAAYLRRLNQHEADKRRAAFRVIQGGKKAA